MARLCRLERPCICNLLACGCVVIEPNGTPPSCRRASRIIITKGEVVLIFTQLAIHNVHSFDGLVAGSNCIDVSCYCEA